jgi:short-subunit dehydrogenase
MRLELAYKDIPITVVCPAGVNTEMISKPVTADQRTFDTEMWSKSAMVMRADRCAHLLLVAGANKFGEVLVGKQPQLLASRLMECFGNYLRPVMALFCTQNMLEKFRDSILVPKKE